MKKAIIQLGNHQYQVEEGAQIDVELLEGEAGNALSFDQVLLVSEDDKTLIGKPFVQNCVVKAEIVEALKGEKKITFKYEPRHNNRHIRGHRQKYTRVKITQIALA